MIRLAAGLTETPVVTVVDGRVVDSRGLLGQAGGVDDFPTLTDETPPPAVDADAPAPPVEVLEASEVLPEGWPTGPDGRPLRRGVDGRPIPASVKEPRWHLGDGTGPLPKWMDPKVQSAILDGVRLGTPMRFVLQAARVTFQSWNEWRHQSRLPGCPVELVEFFEAVGEMESRAVMRNLGAVQTAAADPKNWRAAAWWLERMHPDEFARKDPELGSGAGNGGTTVVVASSEDIAELQRRLLDRAALQGELPEAG